MQTTTLIEHAQKQIVRSNTTLSLQCHYSTFNTTMSGTDFSDGIGLNLFICRKLKRKYASKLHGLEAKIKLQNTIECHLDQDATRRCSNLFMV
jgi:hypothetical protein